MVIIRNERPVTEVTAKEGYDGTGEKSDVQTSGDRLAQEVYMRTIAECFPDYGVIAEEGKVRIESKNGCTMYFTVDALDGTRAYIRGQSHGIGSMIALVDDTTQEVLSAYIGDINTEEMYGYRPGSDKVFRITRLDRFEELKYDDAPVSVGKAYILLRDPLRAYSMASKRLVQRFNSHNIEGSSIGIWAARLWKREVKALLLPPSFETPWDSTPVIGISKKLGYAFMRPTEDGNGWESFTPALPKVLTRRGHDMLIIHKNDLGFLA